ncbi:helix-turn-helix domain-containing protein [Fusobacterium ulcerans]|uniref:helix-turn-helix domain-containing protein n=1 Tax=Fusobacterium ulcerans TaxID=861 RepID=UPI000E4E80EE|nr:helix-turn-helix domain-containing protein [Fusobacterium ulcerans]RGY64501.1 helix-turn-helix domain-containing protein [Fusobacterium ulcerans]
MDLTPEIKEQLGIVDNRKDFYFKVENSVIDGYMEYDEETGKEVHKDYFSNIHEKMVFIVLSRYANNNGGIAFPSISTIARNALCGATKVRECIKSMEKKGFIKKVTRPKTNKDNDSNLYSVKNIEQIEVLKKRSLKEDVSIPTSPHEVATSPGEPYKELHKKNYKKNHDSNKNTNDIFEKLFKEFEINYTTKNQSSIKKLLSKMNQEAVIAYLKETYINISTSPEVENIAALFSAKIEKQERQVTAATRKAIALKEKQIEEEKKSLNTQNASIELTFYALSEKERLKTEKEAFALFSQEQNIDLGIMAKMRENNYFMYFQTLKKYISIVLNL